MPWKGKLQPINRATNVARKNTWRETDQRAINEARNDWVGFKSAIVISWSASFQLSVLGSDFKKWRSAVKKTHASSQPKPAPVPGLLGSLGSSGTMLPSRPCLVSEGARAHCRLPGLCTASQRFGGEKSEALFSVERRVDHDVWQAMASLELLFLKDYNGMSCGISWELFMRYNGISISWGFNMDIMWIHWHAMGCLRIGVPTQREMSFATNEATQGLLIWGWHYRILEQTLCAITRTRIVFPWFPMKEDVHPPINRDYHAYYE